MKVGAALREEIDNAILAFLTERGKALYRKLAGDPLIMAWQDQANHVSIVRLGYNDHGPIHMRIVTLNSLKILGFLRDGGIQPSIVFEKLGTFEDGQAIILLSAMLHDLGMAVARQRHEWHSLVIGMRLVERFLAEFYPMISPSRWPSPPWCRKASSATWATKKSTPSRLALCSSRTGRT